MFESVYIYIYVLWAYVSRSRFSVNAVLVWIPKRNSLKGPVNAVEEACAFNLQSRNRDFSIMLSLFQGTQTTPEPAAIATVPLLQSVVDWKDFHSYGCRQHLLPTRLDALSTFFDEVVQIQVFPRCFKCSLEHSISRVQYCASTCRGVLTGCGTCSNSPAHSSKQWKCRKAERKQRAPDLCRPQTWRVWICAEQFQRLNAWKRRLWRRQESGTLAASTTCRDARFVAATSGLK